MLTLWQKNIKICNGLIIKKCKVSLLMRKIRLQKGLTAVEMLVATSVLLTISAGVASFLPAAFKANERNREKSVSANLFHQVIEEVNTLNFDTIHSGTDLELSSSESTKVLLDTTQNTVSLDSSGNVSGEVVSIGDTGRQVSYPKFYQINNVKYRVDLKVVKGKYNDLMATVAPEVNIWQRLNNYLAPEAQAASGSATITVNPGTKIGYKNVTNFSFGINCNGCPPPAHRQYNWNFGIGEGTGSASASPSKIFSQAGLGKKVYLTISDARDPNVAISSEVSLNIKDSAVSITSSPAHPTVGQNVTFTATCATTSESDCGNSPTFNWTFGDGETATGSSVTHVYQEAGSYTAGVSVAGGGNPSATHPLQIETIDGMQAFLAVSPQNTGIAGPVDHAQTTKFVFQPSASGYQNAGVSSMTYRMDYGDGSAFEEKVDENPQDDQVPLFEHSYTNGGAYNVKLDVIPEVDPQAPGTVTAVNSQTTMTITAQSQLTLDANHLEVAPGTSIYFSTQLLGVTGTPQYSWDFGDGQSQSDFAGYASHTFTEPGVYNVVVQVNGGTNPAANKQILVKAPTDLVNHQAYMKKVYVLVSAWRNGPTAGQQPISTGVFLKGDNKQ